MNEQVSQSIVGSIELLLNSDLFQHEESYATISQALATGRLVVIREAIEPIFAERMFRCLDQFLDWKVYEQYEEHFHYHHHNIYEQSLFPPALAFCYDIFGSNSTKGFMQRLSQRDCSGDTLFSASWYLPGDNSLPHNDFVEAGKDSCRQVAYVWHLSKDWQPTWGGDFFWCPENRYLSPSFNTLLLFTVGPKSFHLVTQVSPYARSKRLAINGWWTGKATQVPLTEGVQPSPSSGRPLIEVI